MITPKIQIGLRAGAGYLSDIDGPQKMQAYAHRLSIILYQIADDVTSEHSVYWAPPSPYRESVLQSLYGFLEHPGTLPLSLKSDYKSTLDWLKTEPVRESDELLADFVPFVRINNDD